MKGESIIFLSILATTIAQVPKNIGKATECTLYDIRQDKMYLLIMYNINKLFMATILKKRPVITLKMLHRMARIQAHGCPNGPFPEC